jgi:hypothetical protein
MTTDERIDKLAITVGDLAAAQRELAGTVTTTAQSLLTAIAEAEQKSIAAAIAAEQRATERARDMQSEMLRGIEAFARGNFSRMHRIETSDADTNARIGALEERVLYLETRRPPQ